ncbi:phage integrase N-terminal SAM-like domain-containing protein [Chryseobacterium caseinilyticum]|uniref:phage integrase N-terminal SAM-like domain-containing protein n=1 Tax=Chryseobacterium caseinilyticum TaxID=2771428 RepID=UPI001E60635A|nr:phage integrase N-terminal SAM-like domain-containing protein [Chryseobacterium caseinilyticum]
MMENNYSERFKTLLTMQRYSENSIRNYISNLNYFLKISSKFKPEEITEKKLEDFIVWLVDKKKIGQSHQKAMMATITKFYGEVLHRKIDLSHLYPKRKEHKLPKFLTKDEVKRILDATENLKHKTILTTILLLRFKT